MKTRLTRPALVIAAAAALAGVAPVADAGLRAGADPNDPAEQLVTGARAAAAQHDFTGVLEVRWSDARGPRSQQVSVRSTSGVVALGDQKQIVVDGANRFVHATEGWLAVWRSPTRQDAPAPSRKWELTLHGGPDVAGRATRQVDAADRDDGRVRERLYFDESTGILLRREQLDRRGNTAHEVEFVSMGQPTAGFFGVATAEAPHAPRASARRQPAVIKSVSAPFRAPSSAGDGFRLTGRYREASDTVHLFYSDGLFGVSVFEQEGELDADALPRGGETHRVAGRDTHRYRTPAGMVTIWQSDEVVYTAVTDAPDDQADAVLTDFASTSSPSALERVTSFVLGPFSW